MFIAVVSSSRTLTGRIRSQLPDGAELALVHGSKNLVRRCDELCVSLAVIEVLEPEVDARTQTDWRTLARSGDVSIALVTRFSSPALEAVALRCGVTQVFSDGGHLEQQLSAWFASPAVVKASQRAVNPVIREEYGRTRVRVAGREVLLTRTEYRILGLLIDGKGGFVTTRALTEKVWGTEDGFSRKDDLYVYVARLREKLEVDPSRPALIISSRGFGYAFYGEADESGRLG